ncbi:hypothetical protein NDU88_006142 [Pleurodeles waltl]|uniref:Secreted protein n=1 Tax=Pleurodeles waltl TaxID=8319 RepID=A0AAV7UK49_PLEWA|nr:hypothetical protein NDU88_006142 [Pleurodeles waltl]
MNRGPPAGLLGRIPMGAAWSGAALGHGAALHCSCWGSPWTRGAQTSTEKINGCIGLAALKAGESRLTRTGPRHPALGKLHPPKGTVLAASTSGLNQQTPCGLAPRISGPQPSSLNREH